MNPVDSMPSGNKNMNEPNLLERYQAGPLLLRAASAGLTPDQLLTRPVAGKWSTLEVISHIADFEVIGVDRLMAVLAETDPPLPGRDERQYAARLSYQSRDAEEQLQLIEACRRHTTRLLHNLSPGDWSRCGIHSEAGPLTLEQLLERVVRHLEHHVRFIDEKRQALKSIPEV
jgi:DinB superfamily